MVRALRLLLVEDHQDSAELLAELLQSHGYSVSVAMSASQALALAQHQEFDVVVSDVGLPDASGYDLMRQLREKHAMKGIALTGASGAAERERGRVAGFGAHLTKPVSVRRIEQAIAELGI